MDEVQNGHTFKICGKNQVVFLRNKYNKNLRPQSYPEIGLIFVLGLTRRLKARFFTCDNKSASRTWARSKR